MLEKEVFPKLAKEGKLYGFKFKGQWFDTGTLERYEEAKQKWAGVKPK
jgi:NDP-sugar pyrophosphorylase family protein